MMRSITALLSRRRLGFGSQAAGWKKNSTYKRYRLHNQKHAEQL